MRNPFASESLSGISSLVSKGASNGNMGRSPSPFQRVSDPDLPKGSGSMVKGSKVSSIKGGDSAAANASRSS